MPAPPRGGFKGPGCHGSRPSRLRTPSVHPISVRLGSGVPPQQRAVYEWPRAKKTPFRRAQPLVLGSVGTIVLNRFPQYPQSHHGHRCCTQHAYPPGEAEAGGYGAESQRRRTRQHGVGQLGAHMLDVIAARRKRGQDRGVGDGLTVISPYGPRQHAGNGRIQNEVILV